MGIKTEYFTAECDDCGKEFVDRTVPDGKINFSFKEQLLMRLVSNGWKIEGDKFFCTSCVIKVNDALKDVKETVSVLSKKGNKLLDEALMKLANNTILESENTNIHLRNFNILSQIICDNIKYGEDCVTLSIKELNNAFHFTYCKPKRKWWQG